MVPVFPLLSSTPTTKMKPPSPLSITDLLLLRRHLPSRLLADNAIVLKSNKPPAMVFVAPTSVSATRPVVVEDNRVRTEDDLDGRTMIR
jgi:hypothetical protein